MFISEIFHSIQGEGSLMGVPSVFVRTSGCNLRCTWCDTPYASWEPEGEQIAIEELVTKILQYPSRHVVLTGGEPLIAKDMRRLAETLKAQGKHITIETAGTIAPEGIACDLASISPKLSHSTPKTNQIEAAWVERHENLRLQPEILREWVTRYPFQLKFVVAGEQDLEEIDDLLAKLGEIAPENVFLMPEGTDAEKLHRSQHALVEICKRRGFRLCPRLHIDLFGNTKGT
jgi:7-carboxy-7-deazaguanine synthase